MKIYNYDPINGEYIGEGVADPDPLEGVDENGNPNNWLIPGGATFIAPPAYMPGNVTVFRDGKWGYVKATEGPRGEKSDEPHGPDANDVVAERNRRLALGFYYDFDDERGEHFFATTTEDMVGWDEVSKLANALVMSGVGDTKIQILTGHGATDVTALEWQLILIFAGTVRQPLFAASFVLQAMDPIPSDYMDDEYWPPVSAAKIVVPIEGVKLPETTEE